LQATRAGTPVYRVKSESGPDHRKRFLVEVRLKTADGRAGKQLARGMGSTKKHAEQDAARRALERLKAAEEKAGAAAQVKPGAIKEEEPAAQ
jgi:ribonuclease-3